MLPQKTEDRKFWNRASKEFGNANSNNVSDHAAALLNFLKSKDGESMIKNKEAVNIGRKVLEILQK